MVSIEMQTIMLKNLQKKLQETKIPSVLDIDESWGEANLRVLGANDCGTVEFSQYGFNLQWDHCLINSDIIDYTLEEIFIIILKKYFKP
jgi:hypothetical protein